MHELICTLAGCLLVAVLVVFWSLDVTMVNKVGIIAELIDQLPFSSSNPFWIVND